MGAGTTNGFANNSTNYQGQSWDLAAVPPGVQDKNGTMRVGASNAMLAAMNPLDRVTFFTNWMTGGGAPKAIDPTVAISQAQRMAGVTRLGALGMGIGGLFGLGGLNMFSPMQPGVPYSATPMGNPSGGR